MNMDIIKHRIQARLYGENFTKGVMEFGWGDMSPELFNDKLVAAKEELAKVGIKWVDADPMSARIIIVMTKENEQTVYDVMKRYGFDLVNKIFDPKPSSMLGGWDTP